MFILSISGTNFSLLSEVFKILKNHLFSVKLVYVKKTKKLLTQNLHNKSKEDFKFQYITLFIQVDSLNLFKTFLFLKHFTTLLPAGISMKIQNKKIK